MLNPSTSISNTSRGTDTKVQNCKSVTLCFSQRDSFSQVPALLSQFSQEIKWLNHSSAPSRHASATLAVPGSPIGQHHSAQGDQQFHAELSPPPHAARLLLICVPSPVKSKFQAAHRSCCHSEAASPVGLPPMRPSQAPSWIKSYSWARMQQFST